MEPIESRANRLADTLNCFADDPRVVQKLADILNYNPDGLYQDMKAIWKYLIFLEHEAGMKR